MKRDTIRRRRYWIEASTGGSTQKIDKRVKLKIKNFFRSFIWFLFTLLIISVTCTLTTRSSIVHSIIRICGRPEILLHFIDPMASCLMHLNISIILFHRKKLFHFNKKDGLFLLKSFHGISKNLKNYKKFMIMLYMSSRSSDSAFLIYLENLMEENHCLYLVTSTLTFHFMEISSLNYSVNVISKKKKKKIKEFTSRRTSKTQKYIKNQ